MDAWRASYKRITQKHGVNGLFRGWNGLALKDSVGFSLFFGVFENSRNVGKRIVDAQFPNPSFEKSLLNSVVVLGAGGISGCCYQSVAFPVQKYIRTRQLNAIFNGILPVMARSVGPSAVGLFIYEFFNNHSHLYLLTF